TVTNVTVTSYDSHNRVQSVRTQTSSSGAATTYTVYNYDAVGNRRAVFTGTTYGGGALGSGAPPSVSGTLPSQTVTPGTTGTINCATPFVDNAGFGLTYTAQLAGVAPLPSWLLLNSQTGILTASATTPGTWSVVVTATDVNGNSASVQFNVVVPVANLVFQGTLPAAQSALIGVPIASFSMPAAYDANGFPVTYTAQSNNGALPSWLSFNSSTRTFSGTPAAGSLGTYTLTVTASTTGGAPSISEQVTLTVNPTAPTYNNTIPASQAAQALVTYNFTAPAGTFTEIDGDGIASYKAGAVSYPNGVQTYSSLPSW